MPPRNSTTSRSNRLIDVMNSPMFTHTPQRWPAEPLGRRRGGPQRSSVESAAATGLQVLTRPPTADRDRARDRLDRCVDLRLGEGPVGRPERQPEREALLVRTERGAAVDVEQARRWSSSAAGGSDRGRDFPGRAILGDDDREVALCGRVTRRRGGHDRRQAPAAEAGDVELGDDDAGPAQLPLVGDRGMQLPDPAGESEATVALAAGRSPRGPGAGAARRRAACIRWRRSRAAGRSARSRPSRRRDRTVARAGPTRRAPRRRCRRTPAATIRDRFGRRRRQGRSVALADLEDRDVVGSVPDVRATRSERGCRPAPAAARSDRPTAGCVTVTIRPPSGLPPSTSGIPDSQRNVSAIRGETSAWVTTSVRPAPASTSRIASRTSSGGCRYGRHRRVRQDARDLLRSRGPGRPPRRGRPRSRCPAARSGRSRRAPRLRRQGPRAASGRTRRRWIAPDGAGSASIPTRARRSRCSFGGNEVPEEAIDACRAERDCARLGLLGRRVDAARRDRAAGPLDDEPGRSIRPDTREPVLLALLEPETRLRAQAVALARAPDADRIEDRGLDDHVRRRVADLRRGAAHDPGDRRAALSGRR